MTGLPEGADRFSRRFPVVWHVVEAAGWDGVRQHGLLSTNALRDLARTDPDWSNRADFVLLPLPDGTRAVLRFQQMQDDRLERTLYGAYAGQPAQWRALIDSKVFFWATEERRDRFRAASAKARLRSGLPQDDRPAIVLAFDTAALLRAHIDQAEFSRINTGTTQGQFFFKTRRDETTFRPVSEYRGGPAAELAITGCVRVEQAEIVGQG